MLAGVTQTFRLALKVAVDPAYEAAAVLSSVEAALRSAYAFEAREFGQPVFHSEIDAVCHSVAGVLAVDVDRLYVTGTAAGVTERLLAQRAAVGANGTADSSRRPRARLGAVSTRWSRCRDETGPDAPRLVAATVTGMRRNSREIQRCPVAGAASRGTCPVAATVTGVRRECDASVEAAA